MTTDSNRDEGSAIHLIMKTKELRKLAKQVVPKAGLEPARPLRRGILNPLRLPFRHLGTMLSL